MKIIFVLALIVLISSSFIPKASAVTLELFTDNVVYTDGKPLFVYGDALPNENLIIRLFAPDGTIPKFDQITVDKEGMYSHVLLIWPESSTSFPYGTYTVEVISSTQDGISKKINVKFSSTTELIDVPVERQVNTLVFAPRNCSSKHSI